MNKIKIIDLLVKIANKETVPKYIYYNMMTPGYQYFIWDEDELEYRNRNNMNEFLSVPNHHLNDYVVILDNDNIQVIDY